ncbi:MAG: hypothetical protein ACOC8E_03280 [Planctomycetota bacterium]
MEGLHLLAAPEAALTATKDVLLAYVGPGAGITLLGTLLIVLGAVLLAVFGVLLWPLRALVRAIRGTRESPGEESPVGEEEPPSQEQPGAADQPSSS